MRALPLAVLAFLFASGAADDDIQGFRSPSGNIHCVYDTPGVVECQIPEPERPARPRPSDCELDWGGRFSLSRTGRAEMLCYSDTIVDHNHPVLPYGETLRGDGWQCTSRTTGITCTNSQNHGFEISRRRQRLF